jgi:hypothetical protein
MSNDGFHMIDRPAGIVKSAGLFMEIQSETDGACHLDMAMVIICGESLCKHMNIVG